MSSFVYDNTSIASGKSDAGPLSVPSNQGLTATEYNTVAQAIYDLRTAVITGDYHGLAANAAPVSAAGTARMRYFGGEIQFSLDGASYVPIGSGTITLAPVGSVPNGDGASLNIDELTLQPADSTYPGLVTAGGQTIGGLKTFAVPPMTTVGLWDRSLYPGTANVLDFDADPTGVLDSSQAFMDAIESFFPNPGGGSFTSLAGTVIVPPGTYRFAQSCSVKRSVLIQGAAGGSYHSCWIKPDKGITAFVIESYNTPVGTTDNCSGGFSVLANVAIEPVAICDKRVPLTHYLVGDRVKFGSGVKDDSYRHFECTQEGITSADADGPISWGNDRNISYKDQTIDFTLGRQVQGATSLADGIIVTDSDSGTAGTLRLTVQVGTFIDGEVLHEISLEDSSVIPGGGTAVVDGVSTPNNDDLDDGSVKWRYIGLGAGVVMRTAAFLREVGINSTSGNGLHVEAQSRECPQQTCNANGWGFTNLTSFSTQGHNVFVRGSDANGGFGHGGYFLGGGGPTSDEDFTGPGVNICDMSFLGNTYISIQMGSGGQGPIVSRSIGSGNTFIGCYVEGTGGGWIDALGTCVIVGGALASSSLYKPNSTATAISGGIGRGLGQTIAGSGGFPWIKNTITPVGWRVYTTANAVYQCVTAGKTGTVEPTGTSGDEIDGTVHWAYVRQFETTGQITFGGVDNEHPSALGFQWPEAVGVGNGYSLVYGTKAKVGDLGVKVAGFDYGDTTRTSLMLSDNYTEYYDSSLGRYTWIPAGNALFFETWIGGVHIQAGTSAPTSGNWNKGDRIYYKGSAVVAGGKEGLICVTPGTAGTYTGGRTMTSSGGTLLTISGALMQTLRSGQDFHTGDYIVVDSIPTMILSVAKDGMSVGVQDAIPAGTYSPTFTNPVFKEFGSIEA